MDQPLYLELFCQSRSIVQAHVGWNVTHKVILSQERVSTIGETLLPSEQHDWGTAEALMDWCEYHFYADESWYTYSFGSQGYHFEFTDRWEAIMFKLKWG